MIDFAFVLRRLTNGGAQRNAILLANELDNKGFEVIVFATQGELANIVNASIRVKAPFEFFEMKENISTYILLDPYHYKSYLRLLWRKQRVIYFISAQELVYHHMLGTSDYFFINQMVRNLYINKYGIKFSKSKKYRGRFLTVLQKTKTKVYEEALFIGRMDYDKLEAIRHGLKWLSLNAQSELKRIRFLGSGKATNEVSLLANDIFSGSSIDIDYEGWVENPELFFRENTFVVGMASSIQLALHYGQAALVCGNNGYVEPVVQDNIKYLDYCHFNVHDKINGEISFDAWKKDELDLLDDYSIEKLVNSLLIHHGDEVGKFTLLKYFILFYYEKVIIGLRSRFSYN